MDVLDDLLPAGTRQRLAAAAAGQDVSRRLAIADLQPGDIGIVRARVEHVTPQRTYKRKRGGEGTMARVTLADETGSVDLVLWDEETGRVADGTFAESTRVVLRGASVKAGYRGGIELALGTAVVQRVADAEGTQAEDLVAELVELGPSRVAGEPPAVSITADALLRLEDGSDVRVVVSGACLLGLRHVRPGAGVRVVGAQRNPVLPGWYWTPPTASVLLDP